MLPPRRTTVCPLPSPVLPNEQNFLAIAPRGAIWPHGRTDVPALSAQQFSIRCLDIAVIAMKGCHDNLHGWAINRACCRARKLMQNACHEFLCFKCAEMLGILCSLPRL